MRTILNFTDAAERALVGPRSPHPGLGRCLLSLSRPFPSTHSDAAAAALSL
jgi:hypothetical protein